MKILILKRDKVGDMLLVTPMATASIGMSASRVENDSADARTGQRLRTKLLATSTQKCAKRSTRLISCSAPVWTPRFAPA